MHEREFLPLIRYLAHAAQVRRYVQHCGWREGTRKSVCSIGGSESRRVEHV